MKNLTDAIDYGLSKGCKDVELYVEKSEELNVEIRLGEIDKYQESKSQGIGIRVIVGDRQSLVYGTSDKIVDLQKGINEAIEIIEFMDEDEIVLNGNEQFQRTIESTNILDTTFEDKVKYIIKQEEDGISKKADKALVESTIYDENKYSKLIINSRGLMKKESGSYCGSSISLAINKEGVNETGYSYYYTRDFNELLKQDLGKEAYAKAYEMIGAGMVSTQKYLTLFTPDVVVDLMRLLAYSFNGENIYKGKSLFKDKLGEKVISDKLNIVDNGLEIGALGFSHFDGDGINIRENRIIDKGIFSGGLYNLSIAQKLGLKTTGNASRSYGSLPSIGYHNLYIENGNTKIAEMVKEMNNGIIIKELMGLHMANPITGEFSLGASGLKVINGKISSGFRGVTISGNILEILSNVLAIGDDFQRRTSVGAPSLLIQDVIVSGS